MAQAYYPDIQSHCALAITLKAAGLVCYDFPQVTQFKIDMHGMPTDQWIRYSEASEVCSKITLYSQRFWGGLTPRIFSLSSSVSMARRWTWFSML